MNKITVAIVSLAVVLYIAGFSISQNVSSPLANAPHYSSEITIIPHPDPELKGTYQCTVKLTNLETGEEISGPNLVLVKGMEGTAGTAHDWLSLDTFLKASSDAEGKRIHYSFDIFYKKSKIGNNSCTLTLE